jgi:hypothetical protein
VKLSSVQSLNVRKRISEELKMGNFLYQMPLSNNSIKRHA